MLRLESTVDTNARFYGVDLTQGSLNFGKEVAKRIIEKYPTASSFGVLVGLAGNGADGMACALALQEMGKKVMVYLVGRPKHLSSTAATAISDKIKTAGVLYKQDCFAPDISKHDVFLESLVGSGIEGSLHKRCRDIIKRSVHFNKPILAIDMPVAGYTPKAVYSVNYPKHPLSEVIEANCAEVTKMPPGPGDVQAVLKPKTASYKSENGRLLVLTSNAHAQSISQLLEACSFYLKDVTVYTPEQTVDIASKISTTNTLLVGPDWTNDWIHTAAIKYLLDKNSNLQVIWHPDNLGSWADLADNDLPQLVFGHANSPQLTIIPRLKHLVKDQQHTFLVRGLQDTLFSSGLSGDVDIRLFPRQCQDLNLFTVLAAVLATRNPLPLAATAASFWGQVSQKLAPGEATDMSKVVKLAWDTCQDF